METFEVKRVSGAKLVLTSICVINITKGRIILYPGIVL